MASPDGYVWVDLTEEMPAVIEHATAFNEIWRKNPALVKRWITRRGPNLNGKTIWDDHHEKVVLGFMGEIALAKHLDIAYEWRLQPGDLNPTDVAGYEVRTVDSARKRLITHSYDKPAPYVLAIADQHTATVCLAGWAWLAECNRPEHDLSSAHWHPAYFTPISALHPIGTLPILKKKATVGKWRTI